MTINRLIVDTLNIFQEKKYSDAMSSFCVGDKVSFNKDGEIIIGIIKRLNQKTISVETDEGLQWYISPTLLTRLSYKSKSVNINSIIFIIYIFI